MHDRAAVIYLYVEGIRLCFLVFRHQHLILFHLLFLDSFHSNPHLNFQNKNITPEDVLNIYIFIYIFIFYFYSYFVIHRPKYRRCGVKLCFDAVIFTRCIYFQVFSIFSESNTKISTHTLAM